MTARTEAAKVWTVAEAKSRLSEVLRLSEEEGPQRIGTRQSYIVVPESVWRKMTGEGSPRPPMGHWLLHHMPRGEELALPSRTEKPREIPFVDEKEA